MREPAVRAAPAGGPARADDGWDSPTPREGRAADDASQSGRGGVLGALSPAAARGSDRHTAQPSLGSARGQQTCRRGLRPAGARLSRSDSRS